MFQRCMSLAQKCRFNTLQMAQIRYNSSFHSSPSLLAAVTNPSVDDAVEILTKGPGFVVYDSCIPPEEVAEVREWIEDFVVNQGSSSLDASHVEGETGHDRIYGNEENS